MKIIKEYEARLKAEEVSRICQWLAQWDFNERAKLSQHIAGIELRKETPFSRRQKTINYLASNRFRFVRDVKEIKLAFDNLDDEEIQELLIAYHLEKPAARYKELRSEINGPESFMTRIPYVAIYEFYKRKKVPLDRQIFVACLVRFNAWYGGQYKKELPENSIERLLTTFPTDPFSLDILMAVFEMEIGVNTSFYLEHDFNTGAIIIALVERGILDKEKVHLKIFEAFNNPNLKQTTHAWARNVHRDLEFTTPELMLHQDQLINLLHNDRNLLAVYGLQVLKKISQSSDFNWTLFISNLEGIVYRGKFNSGFTIALGMLQKKLKKDPSLIRTCCINLAPIFLQPDHKIQLKAKNIFALATPDEEIVNFLLPYVDTMHSEVKKELAAFLPTSLEEESEMEVYQSVPYTYESLKAEDALEYIKEETDFIFLASKILKSQDPLDAELFLEALPRFYYLKTNKALKVALKQAKKMVSFSFVNLTDRVGAHHLMFAKLICIWLDPNETTFAVESKKWEAELKRNNHYHYTGNQWVTYFKMIALVPFLSKQTFSEGSILPLLSTATHTNGQIHPAVFIERLTQYETANVLPNIDDFNQALCRINRWTIFKNTVKSKKLKSEYRRILEYLLNAEKVFDRTEIQDLESTWLTAFSLKNPDKAINATLAYQVFEDWSQPEKEWTWEGGRQYSDNYTWPTVSFYLRGVEAPLEKPCFFGYSLVYSYLGIADIAYWFHREGLQTETFYLNVCMSVFSYLELDAAQSKAVLAVLNYTAQNLSPLAKAGHVFLVLSLFCQDRGVRSGALDWLCQLIEHQLLDLRLFTDAVKRLLTNSHHPIPTARVSEQLNELIILSGTYEYVAYEVLQNILAEISVASLPKGFSKILNHFYEVYQNSSEGLSDKLRTQLEAMTKLTPVKKVAKKILEVVK